MSDEITRARLELMTPIELAQTLEIAVSTLAAWRRRKTGPAYTKLGKQVFYRKSDVESWIAAQRVTSVAINMLNLQRPPEDKVIGGEQTELAI